MFGFCCKRYVSFLSVYFTCKHIQRPLNQKCLISWEQLSGWPHPRVESGPIFKLSSSPLLLQDEFCWCRWELWSLSTREAQQLNWWYFCPGAANWEAFHPASDRESAFQDGAKGGKGTAQFLLLSTPKQLLFMHLFTHFGTRFKW